MQYLGNFNGRRIHEMWASDLSVVQSVATVVCDRAFGVRSQVTILDRQALAHGGQECSILAIVMDDEPVQSVS